MQNGVFEEYGIIRGDWKLISFVRWNHEMLFNLAKDPGEQSNVLLAHPDVADRLRRRLHTWRLEQLDYYGRKDRYEAEYPPVLLDGR